MPKYLSSPRSVCVDGTIYLVADNTKKVYSYDPEENMWQKVTSDITLVMTTTLSNTVQLQSDKSEKQAILFSCYSPVC